MCIGKYSFIYDGLFHCSHADKPSQSAYFNKIEGIGLWVRNISAIHISISIIGQIFKATYADSEYTAELASASTPEQSEGKPTAGVILYILDKKGL